MAAFFTYARNITYYLLFAALIAMAAPGGKYQKYIRLVTGFILIALILSPLRSIIDQHGAPVTALFAKLAAPPAAEAEENAYEAWRYNAVKTAFEEQLKAQLASVLSHSGYTLLNASFDYSEEFDVIKHIQAEVTETAVPKNQPFIRVEPVRIPGASKQENEETGEAAYAVKKILADFYNMSLDNIHVTLTEEINQ